jgi:hypothetical protein
LKNQKFSQSDLVNFDAIDLLVIVLLVSIYSLLKLLHDLYLFVVWIAPTKVGQVNRVNLEVTKLVNCMNHEILF